MQQLPIHTHSLPLKNTASANLEQTGYGPKGNTLSFADRLVKEAESWINTPFEDQGKIKGVGVDCVHFIDQVAANVGLLHEPIPHNYRPREDGNLMLKLLKESALEYIPTKSRQRGDIVAFIDPDLRDAHKPSHLAFITDVSSITTYIIEAGRRGVVRHRLDGIWMKRIHSIWRYVKPVT